MPCYVRSTLHFLSSTLPWALLVMIIGSADLVQAASPGFNLERYTPTTPGEWAFWVDKPWYTQGGNFLAAGFSIDYAHDPLLEGTRNLDTGAIINTKAIIAQQLVGHLEVAASFWDRVTFAANVPFILVETGTAAFGVAPLQHPALSDPKVSGMVRLIGHALRDPLSLHVGALLWIPLNHNSLATNGSVRGMPKVVVSGAFAEHFLYSGFAGALLRNSASAGTLPANAGNQVGTEVQLGGSVSLANLDKGYSIGPEVVYSTSVTSGKKLFKGYYSSLEVLLGAHYNPTGYFHTGLAVGTGIFQDPGTPDFRALFRFAYTPDLATAEAKPADPDSDSDGILDSRDACPTMAGVPSTDPNLNGCPQDTDSDNDGVFDRLDICPHTPAGEHPDPARSGCPLEDTDHDGVVDTNDACPTVPMGVHASLRQVGCPDTDQDGDGIFDSYDLCIKVAQGLLPDPNKLGCPLPDRDRDTVADNWDACPDVPGAPNKDPKKNGCPGLVEIKGEQIVTRPVYFANGQDRILPKSFPTLEALVDVLGQRPSIAHVSIEGHTDKQGNARKNLLLSNRRAHSVMQYLIDHGVTSGRLESRGFGDTKPITSNSSAAGRAINRRVEFRILQK